jgi:hypothetical protein
MTTNTATLVPLSLAGHAARVVASLVSLQDKEDEQPLWLYVAKFPPISSGQSPEWVQKFQHIRRQQLQERLTYALEETRLCQSGALLAEFRTLLETWLNYTKITLVHSIQQPPKIPVWESTANSAWLDEGCLVLNQIKSFIVQLESYRELDTPNARREFLKHKIEELQSLSWQQFSEYWGNLGKELADHWIKLLMEEAKQAREWLRLEAQPFTTSLNVGQQTLQLQVRNPTNTLAQNVRLRMDATPGLEWHHAEVKRGLLEGGKDASMSLELEAHQQGNLRISGRLEAEDIAGNPFSLPFAFQLSIAAAGHPYQIPGYQPYVTGPGLGDDKTFVGRGDLLHWLRSLWLRPDGKAAVVLVGQRRIGKTSLLNKIKRDGLADTQLLPILINIQGVAGDYDFLNGIAREMASHLGIPQPTLDRSNPYPDFKDFLLNLKPQLHRQRFLLMLDEADLIPQRHFGDLLPGFLRALMQEPDYPTLLLFCGTHALKRMSLDYSSILFNTAQFRTVSYMAEAESAEVLQKPVGNLLEFDPLALSNGYRLTCGQPLLLQSLGATLINQFNAMLLNGGERSNYVTLYDLEQAVADLVRQGNAAFENHWQDNDAATHRVLAALAWATDETNRVQLDLPGIEGRMAEVRLSLPTGAAFKIVERLADEEILSREGPTYRFAVPLYRRWVNWRWPPERVREEALP